MQDDDYELAPQVDGGWVKNMKGYHFEMFVTQGSWTLDLIETLTDESVAQWHFNWEDLTDEGVLEQGQYGEQIISQMLTYLGYHVQWSTDYSS